MKIRGTALAPGVSRNGRYYSPAMIRQAVEQAQPRVQSGRMLMKAFHDASDTLGVVGAIRSLTLAEDGSAVFTGELADTTTARDVAQLIGGKKPFVDGVSIAGEWTGKVQRVTIGGVPAETSSGLILHSVDFTANPGVDRARVVAESLLSNTGSRVIFESAPGPVVPVLPERTPGEWAAMTSEERDPAAGQVWTAHFAARDTQRQAQGPSPFWRGLNLTTEGA